MEFEPPKEDEHERSDGHPLSLANFNVRDMSESFVTSVASGGFAELSGKAFGHHK
jgi:hypothetical protein